MVLQHVNGDTLTVKVATSTITFKHSGAIKIGDHEIEGPGEYDVAGVGAHVFPGYGVFFAESIRVAAVWQNGSKINGDEDTNIDIYIFLNDDPKDVSALIKEQDPRVVVLHNEEIATSLMQQDSIAAERQPSYKVTAQTLPAEERAVILLG